MTPERRAEIEMIVANAIQGERTALRDTVTVRRYHGDMGISDVLCHIYNGMWEDRYGEAQFIAAAPAIIRELLAEIDRQQGSVQAPTGRGD